MTTTIDISLLLKRLDAVNERITLAVSHVEAKIALADALFGWMP